MHNCLAICQSLVAIMVQICSLKKATSHRLWLSIPPGRRLPQPGGRYPVVPLKAYNWHARQSSLPLISQFRLLYLWGFHNKPTVAGVLSGQFHQVPLSSKSNRETVVLISTKVKLYKGPKIVF